MALVGWYDFSDSSTLFMNVARTKRVETDGQEIKGVLDKSGFGNHVAATATSGGGGAGPAFKVNIQAGKSVSRWPGIGALVGPVGFAGSNRLAITGSLTIVGVFKPTQANPQALVSYQHSAASINAYEYAGNNAGYSMRFVHASDAAPDTFGQDKPVTVNSWMIGSALRTAGSNISLYDGGYLVRSVAPTVTPTSGAGTPTFVLGNRFNALNYDTAWVGDIGEVLIYDTRLSNAELDAIQQSLMSKWGVPCLPIVSGLIGGYDFSDIGTLFQDTARATPVTADGQLIGSMFDKSGNANHLTRGGIGGTEPTYKAAIKNGLSVSRGIVGTFLKTTGNVTCKDPWTAIAVWKRTSNITVNHHMIFSSTPGFFQSNWSGTNVATYSTGGVQGTGGPPVDTLWRIGAGQRNRSYSRVFSLDENGLLTMDSGDPGGTALADGTAVLNVLGPQCLEGDCGEALLYNKMLTPSELNAVGRYLSAKWGLPAWNPTPPVPLMAAKQTTLRNVTAYTGNGHFDWFQVPDWAKRAYIEFNLSAIAGTTPSAALTIFKQVESIPGDQGGTVMYAATAMTGVGVQQITLGSTSSAADTTTAATGRSEAIIPTALPRVMGLKMVTVRGGALPADQTYSYTLSVRFE